MGSLAEERTSPAGADEQRLKPDAIGFIDGLSIGLASTAPAYSLAAGGAIVSPDSEVLTITPICPHTLSNRSVIVPMDSVVQVTVLSERVDTILTADGQVQTPLNTGDFVQMRKSKFSVRLLRLRGSS